MGFFTKVCTHNDGWLVMETTYLFTRPALAAGFELMETSDGKMRLMGMSHEA